MLEVTALADDDRAAAALVLARAFRDNPGTVALLANDPPEVRLRLMKPAMRGFVDAVHRHGLVEVVKDADRVLAVSLVFAPGGYPPPISAQLTIARGPIRAGLRRALRFARLDHEMRKRHPHFSHYYLWFLGVEPERQGQGLGSLLLQSLSAKADGEGSRAYLETDKQTSVRLYEKHGYRVGKEEILPGLGFNMWFMTRPEAG
jgi:ribosomal protein S18 acetylase RimI-like enzyme